MPVWLLEILEWAAPWITRFFIAQAALVIVKILASFGIAIYVEADIIAPLLDYAKSSQGSIPSSISIWIGALGGDKVASILIGAYTVSALKRMFIGKV